MSRLKELIQEYCPDGVEYKKLEDCCKILDNKRKPVTKAMRQTGHYPYYGANGIQDYVDSYIFDGTFVLVGEDGSVVTPDGHPVVTWATGKIWVNNHAHIIEEVHGVSLRYVFHALQSVKVNNLIHGNIPKLTGKDFKNLEIPIPPLPVQQEIVRILDSFSELEQDLEKQLEHENELRKKQYKYYENSLMKFDESVKYVTLDTLFPNIRNGFVGVIKPYFTDKENGVRYLEGTNIHNGIISDNEELYVTKEFHQKHIKNELKPDDILMVQSGHIGECAVVGEKYAGSNCHALIIMSNGGHCNSKFYTYYFHSIVGFKSLVPAMTGGTVKHVLANKVKKIKVPFPSIEQQNYIVSFLDNFNSICTDLTSGLPAEISLRKKQYEYYRDKLLSFPRKA